MGTFYTRVGCTNLQFKGVSASPRKCNTQCVLHETVVGTALETQFRAFARFGGPTTDGSLINLTQADKWMRQAKVIDGRKVTTTDTAITFMKYRVRTMNFKQFLIYAEDLAVYKGLNPAKVRDMLASCGSPGYNLRKTNKTGKSDLLLNRDYLLVRLKHKKLA